MNRNTIGFSISVFALSLAILCFVDIFVFSKVIHVPDWAFSLPGPLFLTHYIVAVCLIPVVVLSNGFRMAISNVIATIMSAPILGLIIFSVSADWQGYFFSGLTINYLWIVFFHCFPPAIALLGLRACVQYLRI